MAVVSLMLVAAMTALGASQTSQINIALRTRGLLLAEDLLTEILQLPYEDPNDAAIVFGREASETATTTRLDYDDVDDYNGYANSPPMNRDGTGMADAEGFRRSVAVEWVQRANLTQTSATSTGIKRITVTVTYSGSRVMIKLIGYRTLLWVDPAQEIGL